MHLHIILNPIAGRGESEKIWDDWQRQLSITPIIHRTQYKGHAFEIAQKINEEARKKQEQTCIIAIGGDGTVHEVLNGVLDNDLIILGVIKAGSGNDFSRTYRVFNSPGQLQQFLHRSNKECHDCGVVEFQQPRVFVNNCGIGFDAFVAELTNGSKVKKRLNQLGLGKLSYVYYVILGLMKFKPFELVTIRNGEKQTFQNVWFATLCNQPYFGGGMKISPHSKTNDGKLELTVVHNLSRIKLLLVFGTVFFGKHLRFREVTQLTGQHFQLLYHTQLFCHADGEIVEHHATTLSFYVKKHSWYLTKF